MVEPRFFGVACFEGRIQPCISLWISSGSSPTTAGSMSSTLSIHVLPEPEEWSTAVLILSLPCCSVSLAPEELSGPTMTNIWQAKNYFFTLVKICNRSISASIRKQPTEPWWLQIKPSKFLFSCWAGWLCERNFKIEPVPWMIVMKHLDEYSD